MINSNVLGVPRLSDADLADSSEAQQHKSSRVKLIKSDNARLMLAALTPV